MRPFSEGRPDRPSAFPLRGLRDLSERPLSTPLSPSLRDAYARTKGHPPIGKTPAEVYRQQPLALIASDDP